MGIRSEVIRDYHFCNDHPPHSIDPYKHKHSWEYLGIHPMSGDALFRCKFDIAVVRVAPARYLTDE